MAKKKKNKKLLVPIWLGIIQAAVLFIQIGLAYATSKKANILQEQSLISSLVVKKNETISQFVKFNEKRNAAFYLLHNNLSAVTVVSKEPDDWALDNIENSLKEFVKIKKEWIKEYNYRLFLLKTEINEENVSEIISMAELQQVLINSNLYSICLESAAVAYIGKNINPTQSLDGCNANLKRGKFQSFWNSINIESKRRKNETNLYSCC